MCGFYLGAFETENEEDDALERLVPDPNVSDLIFHPRHHQLLANLPDIELTPEKIVELAF